ncbi:hypothetical protein EAS64_20075 [Trebonia kvetii]|uniref:Uncharacterized protein n=1 Tax=Trebonia kvetii TaxID=2480626 RepID=A0A6P2BX99_9ACTN|nr:hypothetical protein [Trebonia kvetii]TVZ02795.1 hypothetical protein EAS64_20075 [Trebonia kvetii]
MNGERAETILRLLAEAELRNQLAPGPPPGRADPARAERLSASWRLATGHGELDLGVAAGARLPRRHTLMAAARSLAGGCSWR